MVGNIEVNFIDNIKQLEVANKGYVTITDEIV